MRRVRHWLRQPLYVRRWMVLAAAFVVGSLIGLGIVRSESALDQTRIEREDRLAEQRADIEREILSRAELEALARRVARQERPTDRDIARAVARFLRALERDPRLRRRVRAQLGVVLPAGRTRPPRQAARQPPAARRDSDPVRRPPSRRPSSPSRTTAPAPSAPEPAPSPGGPTPGPSEQPSAPKPEPGPPVSVDTPPEIDPPAVDLPPIKLPPVAICTDLVEVNCPGPR